ncbi:unnamed protein product [Caenorhabditis auriculariae]|uniref:Tyrosine-protein kinase n=1 Tax=Caenorhabditis auriculariae TaxID=2777116 RepID=A0A8S1HCR4_9PELO|nr:unnamed protein product [Caenorhabditis auriculariae]
MNFRDKKIKVNAASWKQPGARAARSESSKERDPQAMEDTICDKETVENCIAGSVEEGKDGATFGNPSFWDIQKAKNAFVSVFGELKSGSEVLPTAPCEPTTHKQANGSIQKPTEKDVLHQIIVSGRKEKVVKKDDDSFLEQLHFYHGFLPQMECRMFIKRGGDYLVRKWEDDGEDFLVVSVGIPLDYTRDGSEDLDENYGKDEPVRIKDLLIRRDDDGLFIDSRMSFSSLEDLFTYYVLHPKKLSAIIKSFPLGSGVYGEVFLGEVNGIGIREVNVAVKLLKDPNAFELREKMLEEARILLRLSHDHVIEIYGWAIDKKPFMLLIELMDGGSLDNFLIENFEGSNNSRLLKFALEAAKAVAYLHEMDVLHRDVSARNCLLASDLTLKLSGFGFATRGDFHYMRTAEKLPTRYLSPETLSMFVFVQASDCFGFGNLLYEIFTGGMMPYGELNSAEAREKILTGEMNNLEETRAPPALRNFIELNLWAYPMKDRAEMDKTVEFLKVLYKDCKKIEEGPKTATQGSEKSLGKVDAEPAKKDGSTKHRRRKPVSRAELLEEICPTQEETVANND